MEVVDPYLETAAAIDSLGPTELHGCHWPATRGDDVAAFLAETRESAYLVYRSAA
jgi:hypothetical protein